MRVLKRTVIPLALSLAVMSPAVRADDQEKPELDRTAHEELRDAVSKIRERYHFDGPRVLGSWTSASRPRLGIMVTSATGGDGETPAGAEIMAVTPGSPAAEAGLKTGDVITAVNSISLLAGGESGRSDPASRLIELTRHLEDGEEVALDVVRGETLQEFRVAARLLDSGPMIVGRLPHFENLKDGSSRTVSAPGSFVWSLPDGWMDMELVALNPGLGEYFGADEGVLVVRAPEGDESIGLESGDVILDIGGREVSSPEHAMRILRSYEPEEELVIRIVRHGRSETLTGSVPKSSAAFNYRWVNEHAKE